MSGGPAHCPEAFVCLVAALQQLADEGAGQPVFVLVDGPAPFGDEGAVDLGQYERDVYVEGVADADAGRQVSGDGLYVTAECPFPVGHDRLQVLGDVRIGAGGFGVDGDDVVHVLELAALDVRGQAEALRRVGLREGRVMAAVDVEGRGHAPGDGSKDPGFGAEGGVDRRRGDAGGGGDGGDRSEEHTSELQ